MNVILVFCLLILATVSFVTTGVVALYLPLPEGLPAGAQPFVVVSIFVTLVFATWGFVDMAWPE